MRGLIGWKYRRVLRECRPPLRTIFNFICLDIFPVESMEYFYIGYVSAVLNLLDFTLHGRLTVLLAHIYAQVSRRISMIAE